MNRTIKLLLGAVVIAVLVIAAILSNGGANTDTKEQEADKSKAGEVAEMPVVGYRAPNFSLETFEGKTVELSELQGKPVVLNFWASWCGPCRQEMPDLEAVHKQYGDRVQVYGVNLTSQDDLDKAKKFMQEMGVTFPSLIDEKEKAGKAYRIFSVPMTYAIDQNGIISEIHKGQISKVVMDGMMQRLVANAKQ
ncbi:TlpA family protein disulfide reductase [Tumebacillus lipolyticus]|uniref:Redoxin domain-containing protein n=1 Tax=Tumebacillus lipolyticus TaxID=1280370 RepID=A0ABW5A138_9BACL